MGARYKMVAHNCGFRTESIGKSLIQCFAPHIVVAVAAYRSKMLQTYFVFSEGFKNLFLVKLFYFINMFKILLYFFFG